MNLINHVILCVIAHFGAVYAPPPRHAPPSAQETTVGPDADQALMNLEYERYLMEVVKILEKDDKFQEKLKGLSEDDIKSGKISEHVDMLGPDIRSKLNEAKMKEIERLKQAIERQIQLEGAENVDFDKHLAHIDHSDLKDFGKEDLKKLVQRTVADLDQLDKQRGEEFKEYEMKKEAERKHKMAQMNEDARKQAEKEYEELQQKHKKHEKVNHPGGKQQLEEVWEEKDHMDPNSFDPKTFFRLHDIDGNGFWDENELEALFQSELDKVYNETNPDEDDPREREEEMARMREHVMKEMDKNKDRVVSLDEFMADAQTEEFKNDQDWETLDQQQAPAYSPDELARFEAEYAKQMGWESPYPTQQHMGQQDPNAQHAGQAQGLPPVPPGGAHDQPPHPAQQQHQQPPVGGHPDQMGHGAVPPQHQQQPPQQAHQQGGAVPPQHH